MLKTKRIRKLVSFLILYYLVEEFYPNEIGSWLGWSVEVSGISVGTLVQVLLEGIEDILYPTVDLNFQVFVQHKGIIQLGIEIACIGVFLSGLLHSV